MDAIKYWDVKTKRMKITRNYQFPKTTSVSSPQLEGEAQRDNIEPSSGNLKIIIPGKRKRKENDKRDEQRDEDDEIHHITYNAIQYADGTVDEPKTIKEVRGLPDWPEWKKAIDAELKQLKETGTWKITSLPQGRTAIGNKWVFLRKYNKDGTLAKYKARLVAKGYAQIPGMDFTDTFSPVVRLETIRVLFALAINMNWEIRQMDVKGAYLNGTLKEEIYMKQPDGFDDGTGKVCLLVKTLYGLKQAG
jgi:hypothetical protein